QVVQQDQLVGAIVFRSHFAEHRHRRHRCTSRGSLSLSRVFPVGRSRIVIRCNRLQAGAVGRSGTGISSVVRSPTTAIASPSRGAPAVAVTLAASLAYAGGEVFGRTRWHTSADARPGVIV